MRQSLGTENVRKIIQGREQMFTWHKYLQNNLSEYKKPYLRTKSNPKIMNSELIKYTYQDIALICLTNPDLVQLCQDDNFWKQKLAQEIGFVPIDSTLGGLTYQQLYICRHLLKYPRYWSSLVLVTILQKLAVPAPLNNGQDLSEDISELRTIMKIWIHQEKSKSPIFRSIVETNIDKYSEADLRYFCAFELDHRRYYQYLIEQLTDRLSELGLLRFFND